MAAQKVITPDCPRCHAALWSVPCPLADCRDAHFECTVCRMEWVYREIEREWIRFDKDGRVLETIPPRVPRFRRRPLT